MLSTLPAVQAVDYCACHCASKSAAVIRTFVNAASLISSHLIFVYYIADMRNQHSRQKYAKLT